MNWARNKISQFQYRKEFGLSYEEYLKEPLNILMANQYIMKIRGKIENKAMKKGRRGSKR